jgi:hypothetical protein
VKAKPKSSFIFKGNFIKEWLKVKFSEIKSGLLIESYVEVTLSKTKSPQTSGFTKHSGVQSGGSNLTPIHPLHPSSEVHIHG